MTEQELADHITLAHETRNIEFKPPALRGNKMVALKVIRAMLAMANIRDGGHVILGIKDRPNFEVQGLTDEMIKSWNYDDLAALVSNYSDPALRFDIKTVLHGEMNLLVIRVHEFDEIPILCRKEYQHTDGGKSEAILTEGTCYVRSSGKPESVPVSSQEDMRELIEIAVAKRLKSFLGMAQGAGLQLSPPPDHKSFYAEEVKDLLS